MTDVDRTGQAGPYDPRDPWDQPTALIHSNPQPVIPAPNPRGRHAARARGTPEPIALHNSPLPGGWVRMASCRGVETDLFFPRRGQDQTNVMEICDTCPVRLPCREYSLGVGALLQGIWGGQNERQRRRARTDMARESAAELEAVRLALVLDRMAEEQQRTA